MNYFEQAENFANENFSNYDGWSNFTDDYNYADGGSEATALSSLPYVINISNSTTAAVSNVTFLNANLAGNATAPAFGNAAAITITMDGTSVLEWAILHVREVFNLTTCTFFGVFLLN